MHIHDFRCPVCGTPWPAPPSSNTVSDCVRCKATVAFGLVVDRQMHWWGLPASQDADELEGFLET